MGQLSSTFAASLGARVLTAALGLLAMPIYLRLLGVDDFGVVGFFLSLQLIVNFLDLGLGTTLVRQLSIHYQKSPGLAYRYAKTYETAYAVLALAALAALMMAAPWLAHGWLQAHPKQRPELPMQLRWASVAVCLIWMASIYSSILMGIEQQKKLAGVQSVSALLRFGVPIMAVSWQTNLTIFFIAQVVVAVMHWLLFRWTAWTSLKDSRNSVSSDSLLQWQLIHSDMKFSAGMLGIFLTTFLITQLDKMILSKMLSLADFGLYTLCVTLAGGIYLAVQPLFNLLYPRFSRLLEPESQPDAQQLYRLGAQAMAVMVLPISAVIIALAPQVLWVWTGDMQLAQKGADVLRILTLAYAINAVMNLPYAIQLAHGWASLPLKVNYWAVSFLVPAMILSVQQWGIIGGASVILCIHVTILLIVPHITHQRLLPTEKAYWFKFAVLTPTAVCSILTSVASLLWPVAYGRWVHLIALVLILAFTVLLTFFTLPDLRRRGMVFLESITQTSPIQSQNPR